jgi:hypothetical protein
MANETSTDPRGALKVNERIKNSQRSIGEESDLPCDPTGFKEMDDADSKLAVMLNRFFIKFGDRLNGHQSFQRHLHRKIYRLIIAIGVFLMIERY